MNDISYHSYYQQSFEVGIGEVPDILKAWELDPRFRNFDRAVALHDFIEENSFSSGFSNMNDPVWQFLLQDPKKEALELPFDQQLLHGCPEKPLNLMKTHLRLKLSESSSIEDLIQAVSLCLDSFSEYDFSYIENTSMWKGKYLQGSCCCVIHIHLYCDLSSAAGGNAQNNYIVEANRVAGEARPFHDFFKEFQRLMMYRGGSSSVTSTSKLTPFSSSEEFPSSSQSPIPRLPSSFSSNQLLYSPSPQTKMTASHFLSSLDPICKMAVDSPFYEAKMEGTKMLCDLTTHDHALLGEPDCTEKIMMAIEKLILHSGFTAVKEQAIIALARYVDIPGYARRILQCSSGVLSKLMSYIGNPVDDEYAFDTAQLRRECARTIALLCVNGDVWSFLRRLDSSSSSNDKGSSSKEKPFNVKKWLSSVEGIKDERTKMHAMRIRDALLRVLTK